MSITWGEGEGVEISLGGKGEKILAVFHSVGGGGLLLLER